MGSKKFETWFVLIALTAALASAAASGKGGSEAASEKAEHRYTLSSTSELRWPDALDLKMTFLPSFSGLWFEGLSEEKPFSLWVSRVKVARAPSSISVKREWTEVLRNETKKGGELHDSGCHTIPGGMKYRCDHSLAKTKQKEFYAQTIYFNELSDLILVRAKSPHSEEHAKRALARIQIKLKAEAGRGTGR